MTNHASENNATATDQPQLLLSPRKAGVPAAGGTIDLLVRLQAPAMPAGTTVKAVPKRLALVVDRSGSMSGQPLAEALRCVAHIAKHMGPQDAVAVVTYDDRTDVLWPLQPAGNDRQQLQALLAEVDSGGSTDLHAGWLAGAHQLVAGQAATADSAAPLSRVILLSDGQANHGLVEVDQIAQQCAQWQAKGVTTTTVGLGRGFNEDLMIAMAKAGGGQQYYGQTAEDLYDSFDEELALLQAMYWRSLRLKLLPGTGVIVEALGGLVQEADGSYRLSDLAWGAEAWMAVRLHLSPADVGTVRDLLAATVQAVDADGRDVSVSAAVLQLPAVDAAALQALPEDEAVARRMDEVEFAQASRALRDLAREGDQQAVKRKFAELEKRFGHHAWLAAKLGALRELAERDVEMMSKEVLYASMKMSRRVASINEMKFGKDETNAEIPAFLRRKTSEGKGKRG